MHPVIASVMRGPIPLPISPIAQLQLLLLILPDSCLPALPACPPVSICLRDNISPVAAKPSRSSSEPVKAYYPLVAALPFSFAKDYGIPRGRSCPLLLAARAHAANAKTSWEKGEKPTCCCCCSSLQQLGTTTVASFCYYCVILVSFLYCSPVCLFMFVFMCVCMVCFGGGG